MQMPLIEVIKGKSTSSAAAAAAAADTSNQLSLDIGKMQMRMTAAAAAAAAVCCLDGPPVGFVMAQGPFTLQDLVGLDVAAHVGPILHAGLGERYAVLPQFQQMMSLNKDLLGKKSGRGFYEYDSTPQQKQGDLNSHLLSQLSKIVKKSDKHASHAEIQDRCVLIMVNEAAHILDEKLVASAGELDLAMVMGTGFAPFYGGLCAYADYRGIKNCVDTLLKLSSQHGMRFRPSPLLLRMASENSRARFFPSRPDPKALTLITKSQLPRSKL